MGPIGQSGLGNLSSLLLDLYAPGDLASFRRRMLKTVHRLFDGEMVCHNEINLCNGQSLSVLARPVEGFDALREAFFEHVEEHPSIQHLLAADGSETTAVKTSDFVSQRQWRGKGLYREFYRELDDIRYQLTIGHKIDDWIIFFAVSRKNTDFTEEERTLLSMLRPHFVQAYENARIYSQLQKNGNGHRHDGAWLVCNREGVILSASESAMQAVERWFPAESAAAQLPSPLGKWMRSQLPGAPPNGGRHAFRQADHRGELDVRLFYDPKSGTCELLFGERLAGNGIGVLRSRLGMSRRELDVLRWAMEGKTNPEIAQILGLSLSTVKTHMSSILRRLDVETRSAAVRRAFELVSGNGRAVNGLG
jgi:DNA-binding CsgD family transcriptional regulator